MKAAHETAAIVFLGSLLISALPGCATPERNLDSDALWQSADRRHASAIRSAAELRRLESDYAAIIRLSRDGALRGKSFTRLAEIHVALGDYGKAEKNIDRALRADLSHEQRRQALLMLADLYERHLNQRERAVIVYEQIVNEYPASAETELAVLRLKVLEREP